MKLRDTRYFNDMWEDSTNRYELLTLSGLIFCQFFLLLTFQSWNVFFTSSSHRHFCLAVFLLAPYILFMVLWREFCQTFMNLVELTNFQESKNVHLNLKKLIKSDEIPSRTMSLHGWFLYIFSCFRNAEAATQVYKKNWFLFYKKYNFFNIYV